MKSTIFSAATTLLFAAIACAAPLTVRDSSVIITIKTGDGDSATTLSVPLDQITTTSGVSSRAVAASVSTAGVFCQAFSDAAASLAVGPVFSSGNDASYSATSSGGTGSVASDAIAIGSYLCSTSQAGVTGNAGSSSEQEQPSGANNNNSGAAASTGTVRVQLEQVSDQFVQTEIPLDYTLVATAATVLGSKGVELALVSAEAADLSQVECQLFADAAGTTAVGNPATAAADAILSASGSNPAAIAAIACGVVA